MADAQSHYRLDFGSYACRIRIDGAKPGKFVKVLVRDTRLPTAALLHGLGVLSEDQSVFTATFPTEAGEQTLVREWQSLRAEIATYPRYD